MRKSGFTIAEFIICLMIMFVVMGALVTIPFKKAKVTRHTQFKNGEVICDCNTSPTDGLVTGTIAGHKYAYCEFTIDNPTGRSEFFTVRLVGGGAAANAKVGGKSGEGKEVIYPALSGKYRAYLGIGGQYSPLNASTARNGGATVLYKVLDSGNLELMDFAMGGVASLKEIEEDDIPHGSTKESIALGVLPQFITNTDNPNVCGAGGDAPAFGSARNNGVTGGVKISW